MFFIFLNFFIILFFSGLRYILWKSLLCENGYNKHKENKKSLSL